MFKKISLNDFLNWFFTFAIFIISGILIFFNKDFENYHETLQDICRCAFGISTLATIYTSYLLYKLTSKKE